MIKPIFTLLILSASLPAQANHPFKALYGDELRFSVSRKDTPIGEYTTRFSGDETRWQADVNMRLTIPFAWLWEYQYEYTAQEVWSNAQLEQLAITIDDNGTRNRLFFERSGNRLVAENYAPVTLPVLTSHHFNPEIIGKTRLFNTLTGKENSVTLRYLGDTELIINEQAIAAKHYRYEGDLNKTDVWYADTGQWVRLVFADKTGTPIELNCIRCGVTP